MSTILHFRLFGSVIFVTIFSLLSSLLNNFFFIIFVDELIIFLLLATFIMVNINLMWLAKTVHTKPEWLSGRKWHALSPLLG